jgi:uncharacterized membrane protein
MRRFAPVLGVAVAAIVFAVQLSTHVVHELSRTLRGPNAAEVRDLRRSVPGGIQVLDLTAAERTARDQRDVRAPLPAPWLSGPPNRLRAPRRLLVFVDGQPAHHFASEPEGVTRTPYAYYRSRQTGFVLVRCAATDPCREAILARDDPLFKLALVRGRVAEHPRYLLLVLVGVGLWVGVAAKARPARPALVVVALLVLAAWLAFRLYASAWSVPLLAAEAIAISAPAISTLRREIHAGIRALWSDAASVRTDARAHLARGLFLCVIAGVVAAVYVVTGRSWYPGDRDDSFFYLRGAARLLASGSLLHGATDPSAWVYSIYTLGLAAVSKIAGVHPMVAYRWFGYAGAALLPTALAIFTYAVSRRFRAALLACWVGGLWGGLAGYLWLASEGIPALVKLQAPRLIWDDYYDARFLGEYCGPHSEITAYVCRPPFYPREAGLVVFWPALGLLYAGLPRPGAGRILCFALLTMVATAVYPYYGIAGLIVLVTVSLLETRRALAAGDTKRLAFLLATIGLAALAVVLIADFLLRHHKGPAGLFAYLVALWRSPIASIPWYPSLEFTLPRILGGHFFMLLAMGLAAWLWWPRGSRKASERPPAWLRELQAWPGWPLFLTCFFVTIATGLAIVSSAHVRLVLAPYGWIVPWRSLVEPVVVLGTALSLELILDRLLSRRRVLLAALLLLLPCVSALHWTANADLFLRSAARLPYGRGQNRSLYEDFAGYGTATLGRVAIREPLLTPPGTAPFMEAALGVRAVPATVPYREILNADQRAALIEMAARREIGDVVVRSDDPAFRDLVASRTASPVTAFGPYVILRVSASPGTQLAAPLIPSSRRW